MESQAGRGTGHNQWRSESIPVSGGLGKSQGLDLRPTRRSRGSPQGGPCRDLSYQLSSLSLFLPLSPFLSLFLSPLSFASLLVASNPAVPGGLRGFALASTLDSRIRKGGGVGDWACGEAVSRPIGTRASGGVREGAEAPEMGARTHNLLLRREAPYPIGHASKWQIMDSC